MRVKENIVHSASKIGHESDSGRGGASAAGIRAEEVRHGLAPVEALERVASLRNPILLESADRGACGGALKAPPGRYSFVTADPFLTLQVGDEGLRLRWYGPGEPPALGSTPFDALRALLNRYRLTPEAGLPPFQGGLAGYLGYELGRWLERLPESAPWDLAFPDLHLGAYDWVLAWDHQEAKTWLISTGLPQNGDGRNERARARFEWVRRLLGEGPVAPSEHRREGAQGTPGALGASGASVRQAGTGAGVERPPTYPVEGVEGVRSTFSAADYRAAVERIRQYIRAGDAFQVNLSQRLQAPLPGEEATQDLSGLSLYRRLREGNPAPFAAYVGTDRGAVVSASPERFLAVEGWRVETRPIKGTARRGRTDGEDRACRTELQASEKDRAENVMIVDLLRNDLSRVCCDGTLSAPRICHVETHPTVHHLVSTVQGTLRAEVGPADLLEATFPGGSITGAPKIRAMEIISELEPTRRGPYTGCIGYLSFTGSLDLSIAIRTFQLEDGMAYFPAGGGVVVDSDPDAEYRETLAKARGLAWAVQPEAQ